MNKKFIILISFLSFIISANVEINEKTLLFCLNQNEPLLNLNEQGLFKIEERNDMVNLLASISSSYFIERWLISATDQDKSGDIALNRIYKITFSDIDRSSLDNIKNNLKQISSIYRVEDDYLRKPFYQPNDPKYNQQWFLEQVQADVAWELWDIPNEIPGSEDILLASVDTGVDWDHTDLVNNIWQNLGEDADGDGQTIEYIDGEWVLDPGDINGVDDDDWDNAPGTYIDDLIGWDPSGLNGLDDNDPSPKSGVNSGGTWAHGTHVAGLLASSTDNNYGISSIAFNSKILSVKVSQDNQEGEPYITDGYDGILYAAKIGYYKTDRGFSIINNSWGGGGYSLFEQATIDVAHNTYNAIILAASGNGDGGEQDSAHYPSSYEYVISVTALGTNDRWNHWATYHESVDLGSPGENIYSTTIQNNNNNNAYSGWSGTSMATPIAASCIGLLSAYNPSWNNIHLETMIVETSDPRIYDVNSESYLYGKLGKGRVDPLRALLTPLYPKIDIAAIDYQVIGGTDNILDAGEQFNLTTILYNDEEWGEALNPSLTLNSISNYFNILNPIETAENILPGQVFLNESNPFEIEISENAPSGEYDFELIFSSNDTEFGLYQVKDTVSISVNNLLYSDTYLSEEFKIAAPFPNPFNPSTTLSWELNNSGIFIIDVYDINGSKVENITNTYYSPGFYQIKWNPSNLSNGIYFIQYSFKTNIFIQKLTLLK